MFFSPRQMDFKQTDIKGQFLLKCTTYILIQKQNNHTVNINYVQYKQTSTNAGRDTIRSNCSMFYCYRLKDHSCVLLQIFFFRTRQQRKWGDCVGLIHICYSRWSLQLLSSSVRLLLWTQTSRSIAYRVRSASLNLRSLLHSLAVSLCASLPLPRSHVLLMQTEKE